jgi:hypothetical protein
VSNTGYGLVVARDVTGGSGDSDVSERGSERARVVGGFDCRVARSLLSGAREALSLSNKRTMNITILCLIVKH